MRGHHERARAADGVEAARDHALRPGGPVARAELLPSLGTGPAARVRFRSSAAQRHRADRGSSTACPRRHCTAADRPAGDRGVSGRARASVVDGARGCQRASGNCWTGPHPGRVAAGEGDRAEHAGAVQGHCRSVRRRDLGVRQCADDVRGADRRSGQSAVLRWRCAVHRCRGWGCRGSDGSGGLSEVHRRSDGAAFVPEGAIFPTSRASRTASSGWGRWHG